MRNHTAVLVLAFAVGAPSARADVTARYKGEMKAAAFSMSADALSSSIHMKGAKGRWTSAGITAIVDFAKQEITILDNAHKKFATAPAAQFASKWSAAEPPMDQVAPALGSVKSKVESKQTGRTEAIQGIQTEERETTATIEIPMPEGLSQSAMAMKVTMQVWTAQGGELLRLPALRELAGFNIWMKYFMNPSDLASGMPGLKDVMAPLTSAMESDQSVVLRIHMEMSMNAPNAGAPVPFMQMTQELAELSGGPVDESLFAIPKDYAAAPLEEIVKASTPAAREAAMPAPAESAAPARDSAVQAFVPRLNPVRSVEPAYPPAARAQKVEGSIELLLTIDPAGNVVNAECLAGPELLRQAAMDAAKGFKYRPVIRDGKAVRAYTSATVDFDLGPGSRPFDAADLAGEMAASDRYAALERELPRTPAQTLADLDQDSLGGGALRRYYALAGLAKAALNAGAMDKAAAYANELLKAAEGRRNDWNYGNAIHDGHMALGVVALRAGNTAEAREHLLEAGRTPGSPQLDSFGPNMLLAEELLEKGESGVVLQYFGLCRAFWKMGEKQLDAWTRAVSDGKTPNFGANLAY